jgi:flagellar biosynthesis/type III secretory pathway chaperone
MAEGKGFLDTLLMGWETKQVERQSGFEVRKIQARQRIEEAETALERAEYLRDEATARARRERDRGRLEHERDMHLLQLTSERVLIEEQVRLVEARLQVPLAELTGRKRLQIAAIELMDQQHEASVRATAYSLPPDQALAHIAQWRDVERGLLEREMVRQSRLLPPAATPAALPSVGWEAERQQTLPEPTQPTSRAEPLTQEQIQHLARKAVRLFETLPKERQRRAWSDWEEGLRTRFPPLVAQEIITEAVGMRK